MIAKRYMLFGLLVMIVACTPPSLRKMSAQQVAQILAKPTETWSIDDCEAIINRYSVANAKWDPDGPVDNSLYGKKIYIAAIPFTRDVVRAIVRKEAIQRRFGVQKLRERLKTELESFTNYTLDEETGEVIPKPEDAENRLDEYTFKIYFANVSDPYRTVQVFRAEEGFFLERDDGKFTRVIDTSGIEAFFTLTDDLYTMVTFSAFTDDGERLEFNEKTMHRFKLVFAGLQRKTVELKWQKMR